MKLTENFYLPVSFGKKHDKRIHFRRSDLYGERAQEKAQQELSLFFEKLSRKGLQLSKIMLK